MFGTSYLNIHIKFAVFPAVFGMIICNFFLTQAMPHVPVCAGCVYMCAFIVAANDLLLIKNYAEHKKQAYIYV